MPSSMLVCSVLQCACWHVTDDDVWLIKNRMKLKLSIMYVGGFDFDIKSLWITPEEGTLDKTNVDSIAMYFYVQVVSHSGSSKLT